MELFENDNIAIIKWFPCKSFRQTQIQMTGELRFKIYPASGGTGPECVSID